MRAFLVHFFYFFSSELTRSSRVCRMVSLAPPDSHWDLIDAFLSSLNGLVLFPALQKAGAKTLEAEKASTKRAP